METMAEDLEHTVPAITAGRMLMGGDARRKRNRRQVLSPSERQPSQLDLVRPSP